jgi:membrane fusion protein, heavy metal efflux system
MSAPHRSPISDFSDKSMMATKHSLLTAAALSGLLISYPQGALAGPGHDHGGAPAAASGTASPRFSAVSEAFELVGILNDKQLTLYLDRFETNEPVKNAKIELEFGGTKVPVQSNALGYYEATLAAAPKPGVIPVVITITAGKESDLLAGDLDLHAEAKPLPGAAVGKDAHGHAHDEKGHVHSWKEYLPLAGGIAAGLAVLALLFKRFKGRRSPYPKLSILVATALTLGATQQEAWAADGHGHDHDKAVVANGNSPKRLPDGNVFLPKPAQYQIGVRTFAVQQANLARTLELAGKVVMDPNAGGRIQPTQAGRIESGPRGLPGPGQTVRKGEVLAYVVPSVGSVERSNQAAQLAELRSNLALAQKRLARLTELIDTVPRKELEMTEGEIRGLNGRIAAIGAGLSTKETLVAPVSGVIATANVVAGQVVDAREVLFEVIDPTRMRVEALSYEADIGSRVATASIQIGQDRMPLKYLGIGRTLREQAVPLSFGVSGAALNKLAIGQPVRVFVQTANQVQGFSVPSAALMKSPSNQTIVWVKSGAEQFEPRVITYESLDGVDVAVTTGLKAGDRVVTQAATLVNQIR